MIGGKNSLPPGFRFHPTDEELIIHYLRNQASSKPLPVSIIPEVDIYKFDPWQLPEKAEFGEKEWYFFTPRDRKYPNGVRPNRAAVSGYWKATGTDKAIYSGSKYIGVKKALVFYKGRPPKGIKSDWIMHEYRLSESRAQTFKQNGSMRLDDWVLCRIYKKKINLGRSNITFDHEPKVEDSILIPQIKDKQEEEIKFPRNYSLNHLWEFDCMASISQFMNDNSSYNIHNQETGVNYYNTATGSGSNLSQKHHHQSADHAATKFQVNPTVFVNPPYELQ